MTTWYSRAARSSWIAVHLTLHFLRRLIYYDDNMDTNDISDSGSI